MRPPILSLLSNKTRITTAMHTNLRSSIRLVHTNSPDRFKYTPGTNAIVMFFGRRVFLWALTGSAAIGLLNVRMEEKERQEKMGLRIMQLKDRLQQLEMSINPTAAASNKSEQSMKSVVIASTTPAHNKKTTQPSQFI